MAWTQTTANIPFGIMTGLQIGLCVVCFLAGTGYCFLLQNIWSGSCDYSDPCSIGSKFKSSSFCRAPGS